MENDKAIGEINEVIAKVEAALEPGCEIGARDRVTLRSLLKANNITGEVKFFPCRRENSARIVTHFVKAKGVPQNRFSIHAQPAIFILCEPASARAKDEVKKSPEKKGPEKKAVEKKATEKKGVEKKGAEKKALAKKGPEKKGAAKKSKGKGKA